MSLGSGNLSENFFFKIASFAADSIIAIDRELKIFFFNKEAEKSFGYSSNEIIGQHLNVLIPNRYRIDHSKHIAGFAASGVTARHMNDEGSREVLAKRNDGTEFFVEISLLKIDHDMVAIVRDVSKRKDFESQLQYLADYDSLTGIWNRRKIEEVAKTEMERAQRYERQLSLLLIDIDHFKKINDTFGHGIGDLAIKHFVSVCKGVLREIDFMGRWGGEEFIVVLPEVGKKGVSTVGEKLRKTVEEESFKTECHSDIEYTISIGGVVCGKTTPVWEDVLKQADHSLYQAKEKGRNCFCLAPSP